MRQSINSEALKKSIMEKEFSYDRDLLEKFQRLLDNKEVNLRNINDLGSKRIKEISIKLGIFDPSKSTEILKTDLVNLQKIVVGKFTFGKRFVWFFFQLGKGYAINIRTKEVRRVDGMTCGVNIYLKSDLNYKPARKP